MRIKRSRIFTVWDCLVAGSDVRIYMSRRFFFWTGSRDIVSFDLFPESLFNFKIIPIFLDLSKHCHLVSVSCFRYLGLVSSLGASVHRDTCGLVPGLVYEQVELCRNSPDTITCVGEGVRRGIYECQSQFKFERWNCTTTPNQSVFGPVLNNGNICDFVTWPLIVF